MNRLKLLIASSIFVVLPGCALWDAYFMAGYDNVEYALVNKVRTFSELAIEDCDNEEKTKANVARIHGYALELKNFTQYIPNNEDANKLGNNLFQLTSQTKDHYAKNSNVSQSFCKLKLQQINRNAETIQKVIGKKPR
jgi:uncharacterized protein YeeX (DUF496 family)